MAKPFSADYSESFLLTTVNALTLPFISEHYWLSRNAGLDALYRDGSAQRDSHDAYDLNDISNQKEPRDTVTDYSECLLMATVHASPLSFL